MNRCLSIVIPGRRAAASPESILRSVGYGFRARAHSASKTRVNALMGAPRNDGVEVLFGEVDR
jgi:hypothetical protein